MYIFLILRAIPVNLLFNFHCKYNLSRENGFKTNLKTPLSLTIAAKTARERNYLYLSLINTLTRREFSSIQRRNKDTPLDFILY